MLAVQVSNPGPVENHCVQEVPDPVAGPGQVLIDVKAAAVNYADLLVVTGRYQAIPALPFAPGTEAAGIVRSVGLGVTRVKPGDRVLIHVDFGTFATQALARENQCLPLPPAMGFVDAVTLGLASQTAWFALLERAAFQAGERVLVTGASGAVGQAAVQIASAQGATVLAAASNLQRARTVLEGTHCHWIDLAVPDLRSSLRAQVHAATGGHGVDVVIDTLGGEVFDAALRATEWCARIVSVGFASGRIPEIKAGHLLVKNISVLGLQWTDYRDRQPHRVERAHAALVAMWQRDALRAAPVKTLPLHEFAEAFRLIEKRQATGRLVLTMD